MKITILIIAALCGFANVQAADKAPAPEKSAAEQAGLTKAQILELTKSLSACDNTASNGVKGSNEPTDNHRLAVIRAIKLIKENRAAIDAAADEKGIKIPKLPTSYVDGNPFEGTTTWPSVKGKYKSSPNGERIAIANRRAALTGALAHVHAAAVAIDPARKSL